jgi:Family of unknown function (DUF6496)
MEASDVVDRRQIRQVAACKYLFHNRLALAQFQRCLRPMSSRSMRHHRASHATYCTCRGCHCERDILEEQRMAKRRKRRYSRSAGSDVKREMHRYKRGTARSGRGGRGGRVKSRKQAIAIGLSKARKKGKKVPKKRA